MNESNQSDLRLHWSVQQGGQGSNPERGMSAFVRLTHVNPLMHSFQQLAVLDDFRAGKWNTIAATCVGEEVRETCCMRQRQNHSQLCYKLCMIADAHGLQGLDIGEVDLIACYDCQESSTRLVQRMGRTGANHTCTPTAKHMQQTSAVFRAL
jgi:hypothetical protein